MHTLLVRRRVRPRRGSPCKFPVKLGVTISALEAFFNMASSRELNIGPKASHSCEGAKSRGARQRYMLMPSMQGILRVVLLLVITKKK